jgi:hypothetical protein
LEPGGVGWLAVGTRGPRPPVLYSTMGMGWLMPRMYCASRLASPVDVRDFRDDCGVSKTENENESPYWRRPRSLGRSDPR